MTGRDNDFEYNVDEFSNRNDEDNVQEDKQLKHNEDLKGKSREKEEEDDYGDFENENYHYEPEPNDLNINSSDRKVEKNQENINENKEPTSPQKEKDIPSKPNENTNEQPKEVEPLLITKPPPNQTNAPTTEEEITSQQGKPIKDNISKSKEMASQQFNQSSSLSKMNNSFNLPQSNIQLGEATYYVIRTELEKILSKTTFESPTEIRKQNEELLNYLSKLNDTLNLLVSSTKIEQRKSLIPSKANAKKGINPSISSTKLVEVYKREYLRLESRLKQLSDEGYETHLNTQLTNMNNQIAFYEAENKKLKSFQKHSEILIDKQTKATSQSRIELKRIEIDYHNITSQQQLLSQKIEKSKETLKENETKIAQLTECQSKLDKIAKEMYNIDSYENVQEEELNEKQKEERRRMIIRKYDVYEKVLKSNKKKYETEMGRNEKVIAQLTEKKMLLLQRINEKSTEVNLNSRDKMPFNKNESQLHSQVQSQSQANFKKQEELTYNIYDNINKIITLKGNDSQSDNQRTQGQLMSQTKEEKDKVDDEENSKKVVNEQSVTAPPKKNKEEDKLKEVTDEIAYEVFREEKLSEDNSTMKPKADITIIEQRETNNSKVVKQRPLPSFLDDLQEDNELSGSHKQIEENLQSFHSKEKSSLKRKQNESNDNKHSDNLIYGNKSKQEVNNVDDLEEFCI